MLGGRLVEPDVGVAHTDLAMDGLTLPVSMHASALEREGPDEKIVSGLNVAVRQHGSDSIEGRHRMSPGCQPACSASFLADTIADAMFCIPAPSVGPKPDLI